jgi:sialic acid synthase SpsE
MEFEIADRRIGPNHPPFIIAEAGINHEGDINKALELVDAAADAGADCIKFQCHITEDEMIPTEMTPGDISSEKLWDIIKRCELTEDEERRVQSFCVDRNIVFLSTPFSRAAVDRLTSMNVSGFKIGSGECNNYPLIEHIAKQKKPIMLSTGMNSIESIKKAVDIIDAHGCPLLLMHCTSMYPTPYEKVRLGAIGELQQTFNLPIGFSDHSTSLGAVALGASVIEKHFTVSNRWPGPDVPISINPQQLSELVVGSRAIWSSRGGSKTILPEEQPVIDFAYATVVSIRAIRAGDLLTADNIWVKRPGIGEILAEDYKNVLGRLALNDIPANVHICRKDISD